MPIPVNRYDCGVKDVDSRGRSGVRRRSGVRAVLASESRLRLLDTLRAGAGPMDAAELASSSRLHVSTVRFHLDELRGAGLVDSRREERTTRGRPRQLFSAVTRGDTGRDESAPDAHRGYQRLAEILAGHWSDNPALEAPQRAEEAGRAWARDELVGAPPTSPTMEGATATISGLFGELGFDPEVTADGDDTRILLHACPFHAVAEAHPEVVCSLHRGLLRGALEQLGSPGTRTQLLPRETPHLCVVQLAPATPTRHSP